MYHFLLHGSRRAPREGRDADLLVIALLVGLMLVAVASVIPVPGPPPRGPPLPVVLVHGLFGFDRIGVPGARFDYFRGIAKHLARSSSRATVTRRSSTR